MKNDRRAYAVLVIMLYLLSQNLLWKLLYHYGLFSDHKQYFPVMQIGFSVVYVYVTTRLTTAAQLVDEFWGRHPDASKKIDRISEYTVIGFNKVLQKILCGLNMAGAKESAKQKAIEEYHEAINGTKKDVERMPYHEKRIYAVVILFYLPCIPLCLLYEQFMREWGSDILGLMVSLYSVWLVMLSIRNPDELREDFGVSQ